jgi:hypothetical protein
MYWALLIVGESERIDFLAIVPILSGDVLCWAPGCTCRFSRTPIEKLSPRFHPAPPLGSFSLLLAPLLECLFTVGAPAGRAREKAGCRLKIRAIAGPKRAPAREMAPVSQRVEGFSLRGTEIVPGEQLT